MEELFPLGHPTQTRLAIKNIVEFLLKNTPILPSGCCHDFDLLIVSLYVLRASERWWKVHRTQFCVQRLFMSSSPLSHTLSPEKPSLSTSDCAVCCDDMQHAPWTQWARRAANPARPACTGDCRLLIQLSLWFPLPTLLAYWVLFNQHYTVHTCALFESREVQKALVSYLRAGDIR